MCKVLDCCVVAFETGLFNCGESCCLIGRFWIGWFRVRCRLYGCSRCQEVIPSCIQLAFKTMYQPAVGLCQRDWFVDLASWQACGLSKLRI
mmetsp:Transcript_45139/g.72175  ORF Transcript_45139/g.72175 Transcript_45139/m.72175 type:complete len:91 (+) Transcript_45139:693-965(+)